MLRNSAPNPEEMMPLLAVTDQKEGASSVQLTMASSKKIVLSKEVKERQTDELSLPHLMDVKDIVRPAVIFEEDSIKRAKAIVEAFNTRITEARTSIISEAKVRPGERIEPGQFLLAHINNIPQLVMSTNGTRFVVEYTGPYTNSEKIGAPGQNDNFFGAHGSYVVNVPYGQYGKVKSGNTFILLGEGTHVIHDPLLTVDNRDLFVSQLENNISHGNLHLIRVQPGKYAKVFIDGNPYILKPRNEVYAFKTAMFKFVEFVDQTACYVKHQTEHLVRVPGGSIAKIWLNGKPEFLGEGLYHYHAPDVFSLETVKKMQGEYYFEEASAKLIQHGSLKRVVPDVNEVVITNNNGKLEILTEAKIITDPNHKVVDFLNIGTYPLECPSERTRDKRQKENRDAKPDDLSYEIFTTNNSVKVGVRLSVACNIIDPKLAITKFTNLEGIHDHIESVVSSDIGGEIQNRSSHDFLKFFQPVGDQKPEDQKESSRAKVYETLKKHLETCGIGLVRLNILESKIIDQNIASRMAEQAIVTAKASAEQAVLQQNFEIAKTRAEQEAKVSEIKMTRENANKVAAANAELDAATARAKAIIVEADARNKAAEMQAELFKRHPQLLEFEIAKLKFGALGKASNFSITSAELSNLFSATSMMTLFGGGAVPNRQPLVMPGVASSADDKHNAVGIQLPSR